jgi:hypothetical protein
MAVVITEVKADGDNLLVSGTVDGVVSSGHGWVARLNTMTTEEAHDYMEQLLVNGKPADPAQLKQHVSSTPAAIVWLRHHWLLLALFAAAELSTILAHYFWR